MEVTICFISLLDFSLNPSVPTTHPLSGGMMYFSVGNLLNTLNESMTHSGPAISKERCAATWNFRESELTQMKYFASWGMLYVSKIPPMSSTYCRSFASVSESILLSQVTTHLSKHLERSGWK